MSDDRIQECEPVTPEVRESNTKAQIPEDIGVKILKAISAVSEKIDNRFDETFRRFSAIEFNSMARLANAYAPPGPLTTLCPLRTALNEDIPLFPQNEAVIAELNGKEINELLMTFDLPIMGDLQQRKRYFRKHIGILKALAEEDDC